MDIDSYEPRQNQVVACDDHTAVVQFDDAPPQIGTAIWIDRDPDPIYGRVATHLGNRRARVWVAGAIDGIEPGCDIEAADEVAAFRPPDHGRLVIGLDALVPEGPETVPFAWSRPEFADLAPSRPALPLGDDALDLFSPIAQGGVNLVVDGNPSGDQVEPLVDQTATRADAECSIAVVSEAANTPEWADIAVVAPEEGWGRAMALRAGVCLAARERDRGRSVFLAGRLPELTTRPGASETQKAEGPSLESLVNRIIDGLLSVEDAAVTSLLHLSIPAGLEGIEPIIESLGLGEPDAQIVIGPDGCYQPGRSTSDADRDADGRRREQEARRTLTRGAELRDKRAIWGDQELDPEERDVLRRADAWHRPLFCDTVPTSN